MCLLLLFSRFLPPKIHFWQSFFEILSNNTYLWGSTGIISKTITMKSRRLLLSLLAFVVVLTAIAEDFDAIVVNSQQNKWASSNYFVKGINAINDEDLETALDMLEREVRQHPSSGYAVCNLAKCQFMAARNRMLGDIYSEDGGEQEVAAARERGDKEMSGTLPLLDKGIALLPAGDGEALCQAYRLKAAMLSSLENVDSTQVAECYDKAIAVHPCNAAYEDHMGLFFKDDEIVIADALALRKLYPDAPSYVKLLAIMAYRSEDYNQCLELCEEHHAMINSEDQSVIDEEMAALRLIALKSLGRDEEGMNLALHYIEEYDLADAISVYLQMAKNNPDLAEVQLKQRLFADNGDERVWNVMLARVMENKKDYGRALEFLSKVVKVMKEPFLYKEMALCYFMLADTDNALKYIDVATVLNGGEEFLPTRDDILINMGMASKVISEKMVGVELFKGVSGNDVSQRLSLADLLLQEHDYSRAADVMASIIDSVHYAKAYTLYAEALKGLGRTDEAQNYLQKITEIDAFNFSDIVYIVPAYYAVGKKEEALVQVKTMVEGCEKYLQNPEDDVIPSTYYDIAVVYAQMGESDKALEYLEKHFLHDDMPYNFGQIERDWRLDSVRGLPQYKALVEKYKKQWKSNAVSINQ